MITGTNLAIRKQPKETQLSFRGGDMMILSPLGHMLREPWTKVLAHWFQQWPILPFLSLKFPGTPGKRKGFYIGFKGVGADKTYLAWMDFGGEFSILTFRAFTDG